MNKGLLLAAAAALAFSGSVFATGGGRTGASADAYIDKNAQISAKDCQMLSVDSARNECMRQAQGGSGMQGNVGATSDSGTGMGRGGSGRSMHKGSGPSSDSGARSPTSQAR
jgi:hypothetical protein